MEKILRGISIIATRTQADSARRSCFTASLAEAAIATGSRRIVSLKKLNQEMGVDSTGNTPPNKLFTHLRRGVNALDLEVVDMAANPSFLAHCDNPDDQSIKVRSATGSQDILKPFVRVMANEYKPGTFALHGEWDDGSMRSTKRIQKLESNGWKLTAAAIFLRPKTK